MKNTTDLCPVVRLSDTVIESIRQRLCTVAPERGGALIGFGECTHVLLEDDAARYTAASWDISAELSDAIAVVEWAGCGQLTGTVHSHPEGVPDPSGQDVRTTAKALEMNPHLDELLICIVTRGTPRMGDIPVGPDHRLSAHVLEQGADRPRRAAIQLVELAEDFCCDGVATWSSVTSVSRTRRHGAEHLAPVIPVEGRSRLVVPLGDSARAVLVDARHPDVGPLTAHLDQDGAMCIDRMPDTLGELLPFPVVEDTASDTESEKEQDRYARVVELTGRLNDRRVVVAGAGSVGSVIAESLVRSGVEDLVVIDPDTVSTPNLARSVYCNSDVGRPKVEALAQRLQAVNPRASVTGHATDLLHALDADPFSGADLVILATDDMAQQSAFAQAAHVAGVPQVAAAMFRKGAAGEVIVVVPEADTPCWSCAVGADRFSAAARPSRNYGVDNRLVAESALGPAIAVVNAVAAQIAIGLLAGPDSAAGAPLGALLGGRRTRGIIATTPQWGFFPEVFPGMLHQWAPQSVWPTVESIAGCPTCGDAADSGLGA